MATPCELLQESAGKLPDLPEVQFHVGMAHYMMGEEEPARLALQKAVDAARIFRVRMKRASDLPYSRSGWSGKCWCADGIGKLLRNGRTTPQRWCDSPSSQQRDGAVDQAVKTYEKVVADNPFYAPATRQLALLYGRLSTDSPKAYELVTKARQAYPDDPEIAKTLGILNYRRGLYPQAVELLKTAAAKRKDDPELLYYLGEAYQQLKQWTECKDALQRSLDLHLSPTLATEAQRKLADCSEASPL